MVVLFVPGMCLGYNSAMLTHRSCDWLLRLSACLFLPFSVMIRGEPQEDAVLCTNDTTFELRLADTSNSLLICPSLSYPDSPGVCVWVGVCTINYHVHDLSPIRAFQSICKLNGQTRGGWSLIITVAIATYCLSPSPFPRSQHVFSQLMSCAGADHDWRS